MLRRLNSLLFPQRELVEDLILAANCLNNTLASFYEKGVSHQKVLNRAVKIYRDVERLRTSCAAVGIPWEIIDHFSKIH